MMFADELVPDYARRARRRSWIQWVGIGIALAGLYYGIQERIDQGFDRTDSRLNLIEYRIGVLEKGTR